MTFFKIMVFVGLIKAKSNSDLDTELVTIPETRDFDIQFKFNSLNKKSMMKIMNIYFSF